MPQTKTGKPNRGGAPKKDEDEKIAPVISVYFKKKNYRLLEQFMEENNLVVSKKSRIIKEIVLQSITKNSIVLKKQNDPKLIFEINKIGTNLNQISKKLNSIDSISEDDIQRVHLLVGELSEIIRTI